MLLDELLRIENKYGLYTDRINDVPYWLLIRFDVMQYYVLIQNKNMEKSHVEKGIGFSYVLRDFVYGIRSRLSYCGKKENKEVMIVPHGRIVKTEEGYRNIHTDFIQEIFDCVSVYRRRWEVPSDYTWKKNYCSLDFAFLRRDIEYIICKLNKRKIIKLREEIKNHLSLAIRDLAESYNVEIDWNVIETSALKAIIEYKVIKEAWELLLDRVNPKLICMVVSYIRPNMILCEVARERGIEVIEMQHGTMHSEHVAYQYGTDDLISFLPNRIITYSDFWNNISKMPVRSTELVALGFPFFDEQCKKYGKNKKASEDQIVILFISQGTIGAQLGKLALELSRIIDRKKYRILYKLHPSEVYGWRDKYDYFIDNTIVEVVDSNDKNIYECFSISSVQVGSYSTALYEGLGFGLKTMIYEIGHQETAEYLVSEGYAVKVLNAEDIRSELENMESKRDVNEFWKSDARENIVEYLKMEMKKMEEK